MKKRWIGNFLLVLTALIWGTSFVGQRVGMESIEPITFNGARYILAAIAVGLFAWIMWRKEKDSAPAEESSPEYRRNTIIGGICCGSFLALGSLFQQMGVIYTTAGKAGFITAMNILLVPIFALVLFRKKSPWIVWVAIAIGIVGMYMMSIKPGEGLSMNKGDALVGMCAVTFAGHILCCDYFVQKGHPIRISAIQFLTAAVISTAGAFIMEQPTMEKIVSAVLPILYCGIISGGIGYTLQIVAQKYTEPTIASLLLSLESVFAVISGALLLGERMTSRELIGCVIMFIAIILAQIPLPQKNDGDK